MILFINPLSRIGVYQSLGDLAAIEPPLWCRLLSSYCEKKGVEADILDADAEEYDAETTIQKAIDAKPVLVVVVAHGQQPSASTQMMPAVMYFCQRFKAEREDIPVLVIGGHPAALPERTLEETGADFVCTGEGPVTILKLAEALNNGVRWPLVPGLYYVAGNRFTKGSTRYYSRTESAENIWNLTEEMPGGMWGKLPMKEYRAHNWHVFTNNCERQPYASIYTSLNCPFQCSFCMISNPFKEGDKLKSGGKATNYYRMWSPAHVVDEIQLLVEEYGVKNIKIADEMFVLYTKHVVGICERIINRGLGDRLNMWCYARVDTLNNQGLLDLMRAAGIRWCGVGIESMSDHVRDGVDKNDFNAEDIFKACDRLRRADICLAANFMFGLPDDDELSMQQTLDMAFEIMPEWCNFYCTLAYPGTALYKQAIAEGWELPASWSGYSHYAYDYLPLRTKYLEAAEVLRFRDDAFQKFYGSSSYQSHALTKFGAKAVVEIQEMTKIPLKRKLLGD